MKSTRGQTYRSSELQTPAQKLGDGVREPLPKWCVACLVILNYLLQLLVLGIQIVWVVLIMTCIALYGINSQGLSWLGALVLLVGLWGLNRVWLLAFNQKIPRYKKVRPIKKKRD